MSTVYENKIAEIIDAKNAFEIAHRSGAGFPWELKRELSRLARIFIEELELPETQKNLAVPAATADFERLNDLLTSGVLSNVLLGDSKPYDASARLKLILAKIQGLRIQGQQRINNVGVNPGNLDSWMLLDHNLIHQAQSRQTVYTRITLGVQIPKDTLWDSTQWLSSGQKGWVHWRLSGAPLDKALSVLSAYSHIWPEPTLVHIEGYPGRVTVYSDFSCEMHGNQLNKTVLSTLYGYTVEFKTLEEAPAGAIQLFGLAK